MPRPAAWFDAHLDLAYLAVRGRDVLASLDQVNRDERDPHLPAAVTLPALDRAGVRFVLGTIFTERGGVGPEGYVPDDPDSAHRAGRAQLEVYLTWRDLGRVAIDIPRVLRADPAVGDIRGGMGVSEPVPYPIEVRLRRALSGPPLHIGILIENADPIRSPDELPWWKERGVAAVGLAWAKPSRYSGGNASPEIGLSDLGRQMVRAIDALGVVHDISHLSRIAAGELFELTERPIMASHSNCAALLDPHNERHLTDDQIREIGRRGGVIGLNLVRNFIRTGLNRDDPSDRPSVQDAAAHVLHICDVLGHARAVGLGSDLDGGITANDLPAGIDSPADFPKLLGALAAAGFDADALEDFAWRNWARFWERAASR